MEPGTPDGPKRQGKGKAGTYFFAHSCLLEPGLEVLAQVCRWGPELVTPGWGAACPRPQLWLLFDKSRLSPQAADKGLLPRICDW